MSEGGVHMDGRFAGIGPERTSFRILGPVEILRNETLQGPTTAQLRCVLALLLLDLGRTVTAERLIAALWPSGPPASALPSGASPFASAGAAVVASRSAASEGAEDRRGDIGTPDRVEKEARISCYCE